MSTTTKRLIIRDMTVDEISSVDIPAQKGATAVLLKSAGCAIRKNASEVAEGEAEPQYHAIEFADAIMLRAGEIARQNGTSPAKALLDHAATDAVIVALSMAERAAEMTEMRKQQVARFEKLDRWPSVPQRAHLLTEGKTEKRNCLFCGKSFDSDQPGKTHQFCEGCRP